jgi:hypothetical protein
VTRGCLGVAVQNVTPAIAKGLGFYPKPLDRRAGRFSQRRRRSPRCGDAGRQQAPVDDRARRKTKDRRGPQAREHLHIIDLLGIEQGIVALSKCDLVGAERIAEVRADLRGLLARRRVLRAQSFVPVSVVSGQGLGVLGARLIEASLSLPQRPRGGRFRWRSTAASHWLEPAPPVTRTVVAGAVGVGEDQHAFGAHCPRPRHSCPCRAGRARSR